MLDRQEFLQVLVHIACMRFLKGSKGVDDSDITDVSDAVEYFLIDRLRRLMPPMALHDTNGFRDRHCYVAHTDAVLRKHLLSLKN
eukprot:2160058-Prymnesium_polylepis.1